MAADNFSQPATNAIAGNGPANCPRRDKAGSKSAGIICFENAERQQTATFNAAVPFYPLKFIGARNSTVFRKCEVFVWHIEMLAGRGD